MYVPMLHGPGYSVQVPLGFDVLAQPLPGHFFLLPPGSDRMSMPAMLSVRAVHPFHIPILKQSFHALENPMVAMANAASLGLASITGIAPLREESLGPTLAYIREFDAITIRGFPLRVFAALFQAPMAAVEVIMGLHLFRWHEFVGPCLQLIAGLWINGNPGPLGHVKAIVDPQHPEQIEYQLQSNAARPGGNGTSLPLMALPTRFEGKQVVQIIVQDGGKVVLGDDNSVRTGNIIDSVGVAIGKHSISTVQGGA